MTNKRFLIGLLAGVVIGVVVLLGIRFFTYQPAEAVHHHANFAIYINGERQTFSEPRYYEETGSVPCTVEDVELPIERVHMHGQEGEAVHVHDSAVTWGNFFQNIGWNIDDEFIKTSESLYRTTDDAELKFIVNGDEVRSIANRMIESKDKVLISYGANQDTSAQYETISDTAEDLNNADDPAGCGGSVDPTFTDRLKNLL